METSLEEAPSIPFQILREAWNRYDVGDSRVVRLRLVLVALRGFSRPKGKGLRNMSGSFSALVQVEADLAHRGPRNPSPKSEGELYEGELVKVTPESMEEIWNYYLVGRNGKEALRTQVSMNSIHFAPDEYDRDGNPSVIVNWSPMVKPISIQDALEDLKKMGISFQKKFLLMSGPDE